MKKLLSLLIGLFILSLTAFGAPAQLSVPSKNFPEGNVAGARLSLLYGRIEDVSGLNLSILGLSDVDNFSGLDIGIFFGASRVRDEFKGVSLSLANWHEGQSTGASIGFVNYVNNMKGLTLGFVNYAESSSSINLGFVNVINNEALLNLGIVNYTGGHSNVDIAFVNYAESTTFQLGLVNATKNLDGLQVGIINYAENGIYPVLPLINFRKSL